MFERPSRSLRCVSIVLPRRREAAPRSEPVARTRSPVSIPGAIGGRLQAGLGKIGYVIVTKDRSVERLDGFLRSDEESLLILSRAG